VIVLASPALAQNFEAPKACKSNSQSTKCLLSFITALQGQVAALQTALTAVQNNHALALGPFVSVDASAENRVKGPNIVISGGESDTASGENSSILGGNSVAVSTTDGHSP